MSTEEFLEKFPEWKEAYENRFRKIVGDPSKKHNEVFVKALCSECEGEFDVRWHPNITRDTLCRGGVYRCTRCSGKYRSASGNKPEARKKL